MEGNKKRHFTASTGTLTASTDTFMAIAKHSGHLKAFSGLFKLSNGRYITPTALNTLLRYLPALSEPLNNFYGLY
jgi:hypothetical protein